MKNINYKTNRPLFIGYIAAILYFGIGTFISMPEFLKGILLGITISGELLGVYAMNHDISKWTKWKRNLLFIKKRNS